MDKYGYLELHELPPNSWQASQHERGIRFHGPAAARQDIDSRNKAHDAAKIGKTIIQSYTNGRIERVEHYGTEQSSTEILRSETEFE